MDSLRSIYTHHNDLISDKWESYLEVYESLLTPFRENENISLLEIGVQNGGSLQIWKRFFGEHSRIIGCDIDTECLKIDFKIRGIEFFLGDITSPETLADLSSACKNFDIVIDDGSHVSSDIISTFINIFPKIKSGGLYIVEDLHCAYWSDFEGGLKYDLSSVNFFKCIVDIVNFEHWGVPITRGQFLKPFVGDIPLIDEMLSDVYSVMFYNSMCVVKKKPAQLNVLGARLIVGGSELVCKVSHKSGTFSVAPSQNSQKE